MNEARPLMAKSVMDTDIFMILTLHAAFFKNSFRNTIRVQKGIQIRTDAVSVLIWLQTVCKSYQQTTEVAASKERVLKLFTLIENWFTSRLDYNS